MVSLETMTADRDYWRMETVKLQSRLDAALLQVNVRDEQFAALLAEAMRRMCPEKGKCSGACAGSEFGKWAIVELAPSRFAHKPIGVCDHCNMGPDGKHKDDCCRGFDTNKRNEPALKFVGLARCPKCQTEGLLREDGVIEDGRFYTKPLVCEVCRGQA